MVEQYGFGLVDLTIVALSVYYAVTVLIDEEGMFGVFSKLRILLGMNREVLVNTAGVHDEESWEYVVDNTFEYKDFEDSRFVATDKFWSQVFACHRCLSPYVSALFIAIHLLGYTWILLPLAFAGVVVYMKEN